ncbi:hypothetical protein ACMYSQ_007468 [Aspergillus niger]
MINILSPTYDFSSSPADYLSTPQWYHLSSIHTLTLDETEHQKFTQSRVTYTLILIIRIQQSPKPVKSSLLPITWPRKLNIHPSLHHFFSSPPSSSSFSRKPHRSYMIGLLGMKANSD